MGAAFCLKLGNWHVWKLEGIKKIEQAMDVFFDTEFAVVPGFEGYPGFEIFHLEPVFDVNGD